MARHQGERNPFIILEQAKLLNPRVGIFIEKIGRHMDVNIPARQTEIQVIVGTKISNEAFVERAAEECGGRISELGWYRKIGSTRPESIATFIFPSTPN